MRCPYCTRDLPEGSTACTYCMQSFTAMDGVGGRRKTEVENNAPAPQAPQARGYVPPESQGGGGPGGRRRTEVEQDFAQPVAAPPGSVPRAARGRTVGDDDFAPANRGQEDPGFAAAPPQQAGRSRTKMDDDPRAVGGGKPGYQPAQEAAAPQQARPRRVAGWMISFDFNDAGQEYVVREGRNTIGRNNDADISLFYDEHSSGTHAVIVYHADGECAIQDQMSSGGTFINGQKIGIGGISPLRSGDMLKVGRSTFKVFLLNKDDLALLLPRMRERPSQG